MTPYWACAQLQPSRTRLARHLLEQRGYEIYQPLMEERRDRIVAMFPGYLFLFVTLQWTPARWCPGVVRLVMNGDHPAVVPPNVLEAVRAREQGGVVRLPRHGPRPGDRVRILRGVFAGHVAAFAGLSGSERVIVLLALLGGEPRVTLPAADIEIVTPDQDARAGRSTAPMK